MRAILPLLLLLPACAAEDFERPGTWQATGANKRNLRAMVADPADLVRGRAAVSERGQAASAAITRLERDRRRPLPDSRAARVGFIGEPASPPVSGGSDAR